MRPSSDEWARAALLMTALPGLVVLLSAAGMPSAAAYAVFAVAAIAGCRLLASRPPRRPEELGVTCAGSVAVGGAVAALVVVCLPAGRLAGAGALGAAAVEELVFRRELPRALAALFGPGRWRAWVGGTLAAQLVFAACHFVGPGQAGPPAGWPLARLVASGTCLAVLYRASGTLLVPAALHGWINATLGSA